MSSTLRMRVVTVVLRETTKAFSLVFFIVTFKTSAIRVWLVVVVRECWSWRVVLWRENGCTGRWMKPRLVVVLRTPDDPSWMACISPRCPIWSQYCSSLQ